MKIAVTGSSGLVGSALIPVLTEAGYDVIRLKRPDHWDPEASTADPSVFQDADAFIHLAGENIASGRWTSARKRRILDSRVKGTNLIAAMVGELGKRHQFLISASATGYYGDRRS